MNDQLPPHNSDAEAATLGAILIDPSALPLVSALVKPGDFHDAENGRIFAAMLALQDRGIGVNTLTVYDELNKSGTDGAGRIIGLVDAVPTSIHAEHYAGIVARLATRRRLAEAGASIVRLAYDDAKPLAEAEDGAMAALVEARSVNRHAARPMTEAVKAYYDTLESLAKSGVAPGVPTGFVDLDALLGGLHRSDLILLAARPSAGKSSLALGIARNAAKMGLAVAFFSLEMAEEQLVQRLASPDSGVPVVRLRNGQLTDDDWPLIMRSFDRLDKLPILLDDTPGITPAYLRAGALRARALTGLDLLVVDYLQLMRSGHRSKGRYEEITEISQSLKDLAKDLAVPLLALSQLNRDCETRSDKHPMLSDLRESGSLEQDADVVMLMYRDEMYNEHTEQRGLAEIHVAKHRNGPTGKATLGFRADLMRFEDVTVSSANIDALRYRRDIDGDCL